MANGASQYTQIVRNPSRHVQCHVLNLHRLDWGPLESRSCSLTTSCSHLATADILHYPLPKEDSPSKGACSDCGFPLSSYHSPHLATSHPHGDNTRHTGTEWHSSRFQMQTANYHGMGSICQLGSPRDIGALTQRHAPFYRQLVANALTEDLPCSMVLIKN